MNHKDIVSTEAARAYRLRNTTLYSDLDERHFNALNRGHHISAICGYSLDAIDYTPAGAMRSLKSLFGRDTGTQIECERGSTLAERLALEIETDKILAELRD